MCYYNNINHMKKERMLIIAILKKVFLVTFMIICVSFSFCYAIDENQLSSGNSQQTTDGSQQLTDGSQQTTDGSQQTTGESTQTPGENAQVENNIGGSTNDSTLSEESQNQNSMATSTGATTSESQSSTTVSNVSSESKSSTFSNILNIALLVVGVLLVFLAIAILIKLNS